MDKLEFYLNEEENKYGKVYTDINYAIDNIADFISDENLKKRKYASKVDVIKKYIKLLEDTKVKVNKKGRFKIFNNTDKYKTVLENYKYKHSKDFQQLDNCSKCACLNCVQECEFDTCLGCRNNSKIVYCDHKKINVTRHSNFTINLVNDNTQEENTYEVLVTIQNIEEDKRYIIIRNIRDYDDKYILYYYPGISEDNYGEITDAEEFDYIAEIFISCNIE
ncbi:DUF1292 domain-containing protein [Clostridium ganghwense]|uniref:DUF1292 domain-containing protein n=1 Tax=Clostridium ganghwense TaxID=312089 RepID=A0ABT4CKV9_9CLOT|nr:DUF1292 domain-containing protein [Clostridium ganghwense]MCY6369573.1 DUF1292 domain-containing protein [Clostridium ganghwense]